MSVAPSLRSLPFENGDVMGRDEFHRLYDACEGLERVELIEGVVYLPSPIRALGNAEEQALVLEWLGRYRGSRRDLKAHGPATILLDDENEPEPDAVLYHVDSGTFSDGYLARAPELVVEIAATSAARDLHQKKRAYERNRVREYIVWRTQEGAVDWFRLSGGVYAHIAPDARGLIESEAFPGLRLDVAAMLQLDREAVLAAVTPAGD